jgi:hypothetical protein
MGKTEYFDEIEVGQGQHFILWMKSKTNEKIKAIEINEANEIIAHTIKGDDFFIKENSLESWLNRKDDQIAFLEKEFSSKIKNITDDLRDHWSKANELMEKNLKELSRQKDEQIERVEKEVSSKLKNLNEDLDLKIGRTSKRLVHLAEYLCKNLNLNVADALFEKRVSPYDQMMDGTLQVDLKDITFPTPLEIK